MSASFLTLKTAAMPKTENQPPYAAVSARTKPQHMVAFLFPTLQGMHRSGKADLKRNTNRSCLLEELIVNRKVDNHFTQPDFWILQGMDMMEP